MSNSSKTCLGVFVASLLMALTGPVLKAQSLDEQVAAAKIGHQGKKGSLTTCPSTAIFPPVTLTGSIGYSSCVDVIGLREDVYSVNVSAGQTIDLDYSSNSFDTFLYMYLGNGTSIPTNRVSFLPFSGVGTSRVTAHYTFTASGTYYIEAESLWSSDTSTTLPWRGPYTLSVALSGGSSSGGCTTTGTALCVTGSRFSITVAWKTPDGASGSATPVKLTSDSGYFWFFQSSNVELVVKVLDARAVNGKFWVFYGALSDVDYTITVRDTSTGLVKTYHNPAKTMASFADTSAF